MRIFKVNFEQPGLVEGLFAHGTGLEINNL